MSKNYSDKLLDPKWQRKRLEILQRDNFTCDKCGDTETTLHVHHLKYTKEPWDAPNKDLQTLCNDCHYLIHNVDMLGVVKVLQNPSADKTHKVMYLFSKDNISVYYRDYSLGTLEYAITISYKTIDFLVAHKPL